MIINKINNKSGFSLVELLVVMGIIALFSIVAIPKYSNISSQAKLAKTKTNMLNIRNAFVNYSYNLLITKGRIEIIPAPTDSLLTQNWASITLLEDGKTPATLFSGGIMIQNPYDNPYRYGILEATDNENEGFILRDPDFNLELRFRP